VSLSGGTLASTASCTVSVDVQGATAGVKNNSVQVTSTEGGTGNTSNASITVTGPPVIIKAFGAASIPLNGTTSLTFTIQHNNTTGNVTSTQGGTGGTASASVKVEAPPSIAKVFNPSTISLNATTSLTFTITNPAANVDALAGVAFTDTLPTGLTVANASATVCGGTLTTTNPTGIALTGATIAANSQCQFSVTVTGAAAGNFT